MADYVGSFTGRQIDALLAKIDSRNDEVQSGTAYFTSVSTDCANLTVTFSNAFSGTPTVTLTPVRSSTATPSGASVHVVSSSTTTTQFDIRAETTSSSGVGLYVNWIAVYTP